MSVMNQVIKLERATKANYDKISFGLLIAVVLHVVIVFGVVFQWVATIPADTNNLGVTLVTHYAEQAPDSADFMAQANQQASGTLLQRAEPTSLRSGRRQQQQEQAGVNQAISTLLKQGEFHQRLLAAKKQNSADLLHQEGESGLMQQAQNAVRRSQTPTRAKLDVLQQEYAKRPKVGTLTSVAAVVRVDAAYQLYMQERIILIGNKHYPKDTFAKKIFGDVRIILTINASGELEKAEVSESSGHQELDDAAIEIAKKASPFKPFNSELSARYDKVLFIRTWRFLPSGQLKASS